VLQFILKGFRQAGHTEPTATSPHRWRIWLSFHQQRFQRYLLPVPVAHCLFSRVMSHPPVPCAC